MKTLLSFLLFICSCVPLFASAYDFVVDASGKGNFKTVQAAIDAVPHFRNKVTTIFVRKGIYKEKLVLAGSKKNVRLVGEDRDHTILTFDDYAAKKNRFGENIGTSGSSSFYIYGDGFSAENITFENSSGPVGQAVAVQAIGDKLHFKNCRFLGFQDTLYTYGSGRQFYEDCYIEGTTDFIFGSATVFFRNCEIHCKKGGQYITAASTAESSPFGYVFEHCKITGKEGLSYYLGRPWRPYAKVVFINCELPGFIKPEGWHNWGKESNEKTAFYAEHRNSGEGFRPESRVAWSKQLSKEDITRYTIDTVFQGWMPQTD